MERSNVKCPVFAVLAIFCHVSLSIAMESTCTKFKYEEQLLEKMVRMEFYVENIVNDLNKTISDSVEGLAADIGNIQTNITRRVEDFQLQNEEWKENVQRETTSALEETKTEISETEKLLKAEIHDLQATITKSSTGTKLMEENVQREMTAALEKTKTEISETVKLLKAEIHDLQATVTKSLTDTKLSEENIENKIATAIEDAKKEIKLLKAEIGQFKGTTLVVAFSAYHVTNLSPGISNPVVFETVLLNEGEGYDATTGYFTATVAGVYQFNAQLCVTYRVYLDYAITVNGDHIARGLYTSSIYTRDGACVSFSAIGIVRQGQKAEVRGWSGALFNNDDDWNSFSGVLIKAL